jgi:hypothetical protein
VLLNRRTTDDRRSNDPALAQGCVGLACWTGGKRVVRDLEIKELPAK